MAHPSFQRRPSNQNMGRGPRSDRQPGIILRQSPGKPFPLPYLWFSSPIPQLTSPLPTASFLLGEFVFPELIHCVPRATVSPYHPSQSRNKEMPKSVRLTVGHLTATQSHNMPKYKHPSAIYPPSQHPLAPV